MIDRIYRSRRADIGGGVCHSPAKIPAASCWLIGFADRILLSKMALAMPHPKDWMLEGKRLQKAIAETLMSAILTERACSSS